LRLPLHERLYLAGWLECAQEWPARLPGGPCVKDIICRPTLPEGLIPAFPARKSRVF